MGTCIEWGSSIARDAPDFVVSLLDVTSLARGRTAWPAVLLQRRLRRAGRLAWDSGFITEYCLLWWGKQGLCLKLCKVCEERNI